MTERRTCDYLRGMRARGHDFKLPDFSTILNKKEIVFSICTVYVHVMLLLFFI